MSPFCLQFVFGVLYQQDIFSDKQSLFNYSGKNHKISTKSFFYLLFDVLSDVLLSANQIAGFLSINNSKTSGVTKLIFAYSYISVKATNK